MRTPPVPRRRGPGLRDGAAAKAESQAAPRIAFVLFATPNGRWRRVLSGGGLFRPLPAIVYCTQFLLDCGDRN